MKKLAFVFMLLLVSAALLAWQKDKPGTTSPPPAKSAPDYSGMYTFLREGEFVQVTIEDAGRVTGFVSRYGDLESDRGAFLDHFFKQGGSISMAQSSVGTAKTPGMRLTTS